MSMDLGRIMSTLVQTHRQVWLAQPPLSCVCAGTALWLIHSAGTGAHGSGQPDQQPPGPTRCVLAALSTCSPRAWKSSISRQGIRLWGDSFVWCPRFLPDRTPTLWARGQIAFSTPLLSWRLPGILTHCRAGVCMEVVLLLVQSSEIRPSTLLCAYDHWVSAISPGPKPFSLYPEAVCGCHFFPAC